MTNPFAVVAAPTGNPTTDAAMATAANAAFAEHATTAFKAAEETKLAKPTDAPKDLGIGDPFAEPTGIGDGERITDFVGNLLLVKPTEFISQMKTSQGLSDAVRIDMAVLDDADEPGKVIRGVLLFQQALRREAKAIMDGPLPYLLGRLNKGITNNGNTLYTFENPTDEEKDLARMFIKTRPGAL